MSDSGQTSGSAHDPWDAPYFGAPIYLSYPVFRGTVPGAVNGALTFRGQAAPDHPAPSEPRSDPAPTAQQVELGHTVPAPSPTPTPRRRGWLARLFGAR
jgi:hypothetical protein